MLLQVKRKMVYEAKCNFGKKNIPGSLVRFLLMARSGEVPSRIHTAKRKWLF